MDYSIAKDALKDKIILLTGAGDGIGKQAALSFAEHGAQVLLLGRTVKNSNKPMMRSWQQVALSRRLSR
ncbi:hypothetical protein JCM19236_6495 [Vibrio sp. JCM 19236]|nr:hypothetical protein JCM19236_6495 [Vibrio sp. JCM 19236]